MSAAFGLPGDVGYAEDDMRPGHLRCSVVLALLVSACTRAEPAPTVDPSRTPEALTEADAAVAVPDAGVAVTSADATAPTATVIDASAPDAYKSADGAPSGVVGVEPRDASVVKPAGRCATLCARVAACKVPIFWGMKACLEYCGAGRYEGTFVCLESTLRTGCHRELIETCIDPCH